MYSLDTGYPCLTDRKPSNIEKSSVPDPDPYVFGPPKSASGSVIYSTELAPDPDPSNNKQTMKKTLDFCCFVTFYDFLSLKNDVDVPLIRNKHKN